MKIIIAIGLALLASTASAAKPPQINQKLLRSSFEDRLKDADSAKFKDITQTQTKTEGAWRLCGQVNAKNSYGAFNGYESFIGMTFKEKGQPVQYLIIGIGESAGEVCKRPVD